MFNLKDFPHRAVFEASPIIYASSLKNAEPEIARASLDNLRGLFPHHLDLEKNIDLLAVAFNAATVNVANLNDDIIDTHAAMRIVSSFSGKQINLEHKRDKIVGHITAAGFSSCGESNLLFPMDVENTQDPFHIALGGVIYRIVDKDLADSIEDSANPDSSKYQSWSASWEVAFPDFNIAVGSRNMKEAEIISNPIQVEELKKHLKAYKGSGSYNNSPIYRLIKDNALATGIGVTRKPAGRVVGLVTKDSPPQKTTATFFGSFFENPDKNKKTCVTTSNPDINMELETILKEVKASLAEISASKLKEEAKANLVSDISEKLLEANKEFVAKTNEAKAAKEKAEADLVNLKATQEAQATELAATKQKLADLEAKASAEASANLFSARMDEMNQEFDLDDEDRAVLASEIKTLDEKPESFAAWKDKMGKLMKDKNKKGKEAKEKEAKAAVELAVAAKLKELSTASANKGLTEKELAAKALEEATAKEKENLPNTNSGQADVETLRAKWKNAFNKDSVTISQ